PQSEPSPPPPAPVPAPAPVRGAARQTAPPRESLPPPPLSVPAREPAEHPLQAVGPRPRREGNVSPVLRALQLHDTYLLVEVPEGMLVIDQHALHERILYEQMKERLAAGDLEQQRLLIPEPIELPAHQAALVLDRRADLAELGLEVEGFGGSTVLLHGYPAVLGKRTPQAIFRAAVD